MKKVKRTRIKDGENGLVDKWLSKEFYMET
jgi:hypothetical protein